jgi:hypothetical protein
VPPEQDRKSFDLDTQEVARRLGVAVSTLNFWLRADHERHPSRRIFDFHRYRGRKRFWSEESFELLEAAIHRESQDGVLAPGRKHRTDYQKSESDPDAEAALRSVLGKRLPRP